MLSLSDHCSNSAEPKTPLDQNCMRSSLRVRWIAGILIVAILGITDWRCSMKTLSLSINGPFPRREYSLTGVRLSNGKSHHFVQAAHPEIASVRYVCTDHKNEDFNVGLGYSFAGPPSTRRVIVTASLLDAKGEQIAAMSRTTSDVRVNTDDQFFGYAPARENSHTFFFQRLDRTQTIARVNIVLRNETWVDVWAEKAFNAVKSGRSRAAALLR